MQHGEGTMTTVFHVSGSCGARGVEAFSLRRKRWAAPKFSGAAAGGLAAAPPGRASGDWAGSARGLATAAPGGPAVAPSAVGEVRILRDGQTRWLRGFEVRWLAIAPGCAAAYFPEATPLVPLGLVAAGARTPAAKALPIRLHPAGQ